MKVLLSWLREFVEVPEDLDEVRARLDFAGLPVETAQTLEPTFSDVVVGAIVEIAPHPDGENLRLCRVDVGGETVSIVCGATNVDVGQRVPVAVPGSVLMGKYTIGVKDIRGVSSYGMMCSAAELELGEDEAGILILDPGAPIGADLADAFSLRDTLLELEVASNRPDCLGIIGIGREIAALFDRELEIPPPTIAEYEVATADVVAVDIYDPDLCPRYTCRLVTDATVGNAPLLAQWRLRALGVRPISNVVDATNYVMLETGQPLHAFDFDTIGGSRIVVRRALAGESLRTLDETERTLDESILVIADAHRAVALAGIMGGEDTEVNEGTGRILIESAHFQPASIMRSSRRLGLVTEASNRFEKGVDPNGTVYAANRTAHMIQAWTGGTVYHLVVDEYPKTIAPVSIAFRPERASKVLGMAISHDMTTDVFRRLGFRTDASSDRWMVTPPTSRGDLRREEDLIEEVARIYGYERFPSTLPRHAEQGVFTHLQSVERIVRAVLEAAGLTEAVNYGFTDPDLLARLQVPEDHPWRSPVTILNPLSRENAVMRPTLLGGLLATIARNHHRGVEDAMVYEIGHVFTQVVEGGEILPIETTMVGIALSGALSRRNWWETALPADYYDGKGIVEMLGEQLGLDALAFDASQTTFLHPRRQAALRMEDETIGIIGEIDPSIARAFEIDRTVVVAEMDLTALAERTAFTRSYREIPKLPSVRLDLAIVIDEEVPYETVERIVRDAGGTLLESIEVFDVFSGGAIPPGKKSIALSVVFRSPERTLLAEEAKASLDAIAATLEKNLSAKVRD